MTRSRLKKSLRALDQFIHVAYSFGLTVNLDKTKVMAAGYGLAEADRLPLDVAGEVVECVDSFRYLGSLLHTNGRSTPDISSRIAGASRAFGALRQPVFADGNLSLATKQLVYGACVLSLLLYCAECWVPLKPDLDALCSFHLRCIRSVMGISQRNVWDERLTRVDVLERWNPRQPRDIPSLLTSRRIEWLGHVVRMHEERAPRQLLFGTLHPVHPMCGPRKRWRDATRKDLAALGIDECQWNLATGRKANQKANHQGHPEQCNAFSQYYCVAARGEFQMIISSNGRICYCSPNVESLLGVRDVEVMGNKITDFVDPDDAHIITPHLQRLNQIGVTQAGEDGPEPDPSIAGEFAAPDSCSFAVRMKCGNQKKRRNRTASSRASMAASSKSYDYWPVRCHGQYRPPAMDLKLTEPLSLHSMVILCKPDVTIGSVSMESRPSGMNFRARYNLAFEIVKCHENDQAVFTGQKDLIGKSLYALIHPLDAEKLREKHHALVHGNEDSITMQLRYLRPNNSSVLVEMVANLERTSPRMYINVNNYIVSISAQPVMVPFRASATPVVAPQSPGLPVKQAMPKPPAAEAAASATAASEGHRPQPPAAAISTTDSAWARDPLLTPAAAASISATDSAFAGRHLQTPAGATSISTLASAGRSALAATTSATFRRSSLNVKSGDLVSPDSVSTPDVFPKLSSQAQVSSLALARPASMTVQSTMMRSPVSTSPVFVSQSPRKSNVTGLSFAQAMPRSSEAAEAAAAAFNAALAHQLQTPAAAATISTIATCISTPSATATAASVGSAGVGLPGSTHFSRSMLVQAPALPTHLLPSPIAIAGLATDAILAPGIPTSATPNSSLSDAAESGPFTDLSHGLGSSLHAPLPSVIPPSTPASASAPSRREMTLSQMSRGTPSCGHPAGYPPEA
ncbi:uncharacterized protein LOC135823688 [Sycon ciliatum]|uniref:uncharacterized protein LOC135823688 n=1 Tax=Sycon ciliatum TaxID=27933 RepID=UPI0031F5FE14